MENATTKKSRCKEKRYWTKEEENQLIKLAETKLDSEIAKIMKRTKSSIKGKRLRMEIPCFVEQRDILMGSEIAELVGEHTTSIYKTWVMKGLHLKAKGPYKTVSEKQFIKFMKEHPELWKASKCDYYYFCRFQWFKDRLEQEKAGNEKYNHYKNIRKWTEKDISRMKMLKRRGMTHLEIAKEMGRTRRAIDHVNKRIKDGEIV